MFENNSISSKKSQIERQYLIVIKPFEKYIRKDWDIPDFTELTKVANSKRYVAPDTKSTILHVTCNTSGDFVELTWSSKLGQPS